MILLISSEVGMDTQRAEKSWTFVSAVSGHKPFHQDAGRAFPVLLDTEPPSPYPTGCVSSTIQQSEKERRRARERTLCARAEPRS